MKSKSSIWFAVVVAIFLMGPLSLAQSNPESVQEKESDERAETENANQPVKQKWRKFAENEWYELSEFRMTKDRSLVLSKIKKSDILGSQM